MVIYRAKIRILSNILVLWNSFERSHMYFSCKFKVNVTLLQWIKIWSHKLCVLFNVPMMDEGSRIHFCRKSLWLSCETDNSIDWGHKKRATEKTEMRLANNFFIHRLPYRRSLIEIHIAFATYRRSITGRSWSRKNSRSFSNKGEGGDPLTTASTGFREFSTPAYFLSFFGQNFKNYDYWISGWILSEILIRQ